MESILSILRKDAKAWWHFQDLRKQGNIKEAQKLERAEILENVKRFRLMMKNGGHASVGRGGHSLKYVDEHGHSSRLEGYEKSVNGADIACCIRLGIVVIDTTTISDARIYETIKCSLVADSSNKPTGTGSTDYAPLGVVIEQYRKLGATIYNA